jgi:hypothetical protein
MKRRFAWFLGLSLVANPAWGQDKTEPPGPETPRGELPPATPAPAPAMEAPVTDAFVAPAAAAPTFTLNVEFLEWWYKGNPIPPLLNTAPETNTQFAGTTLDPNARTILGRQALDFQNVPGLRANFTVALAERWDVELNGFLMESQSVTRFFGGVNGQPFLTRPFFNAHDQVESGYDTSSASGLSGSVGATATNKFWGYEANMAWHSDLPDSPLNKLLVGFRQISLSENLTVLENVSSAGAPAGGPPLLAFFPTVDANGTLVSTNFNPATQTIRIIDGFRTRNDFYGPQAGAQFRWRRGPFSFDFLAKVAVGVNHETIEQAGATSLLTGGVVTATGPGGLLVVSTNTGRQTYNELTVVPEVGLKLGFDVTERVKFQVGYNVLYLSSVVRPGNQIDTRINPQLVPSDVAYNPVGANPGLPRGFFRDTDFYAHGVSFGLLVSY